MKGLNRNQLKYIAIITMIIDYVAFAFIYNYGIFLELNN